MSRFNEVNLDLQINIGVVGQMKTSVFEGRFDGLKNNYNDQE